MVFRPDNYLVCVIFVNVIVVFETETVFTVLFALQKLCNKEDDLLWTVCLSCINVIKGLS